MNKRNVVMPFNVGVSALEDGQHKDQRQEEMHRVMFDGLRERGYRLTYSCRDEVDEEADKSEVIIRSDKGEFSYF